MEKPPISSNNTEETLKLLTRIRDSEHAVTDEERKLFANSLLESMKNSTGIYMENVNDLYNNVRERLLVRRESPERALNLTLQHFPIHIGFEGKNPDPYYNAAYWDGAGHNEGLKNAFTEGFAEAGGIVTVIGFRKGKNMIEHRPERLIDEIGDTGLPHQNNISIEGDINPKNVAMLVARIPFNFILEDSQTEMERSLVDENRSPQYAFRGIFFPEKRKDDASENASSMSAQ